MAYLGLARKWRSQTFADLVGQQHIALTILNAIKSGRISQGYLFTGTRGIGKTSAARIFAKALRCTQPPSPGVPCNKCTDCNEISEGKSVDVLEIDGASNNGVDAVREIRENVKYLPSTGKYKVYIIDEVHMLTTAAFNALLKTLEEPPAHVVFIFATTDPQKIPATVLSRTQRFDFKRISQKDLHEHLKNICASEKIEISADALAILAREAEGSMRDGVSLLDQILSVADDGKITADAVVSALGVVDKKTVLDCVTGILKRDPLLALEAVGRVHMHGFDLKQFGRELLRYFRLIMVASLLEKNKANPSGYLDVSDVDLADIKALLQERSLEDLDMLFRLLNHGLEDVARSALPKTVMDVLVIKMAAAEELIALQEVSSPSSFGGNAEPTTRQATLQKAQPVAPKVAAPVTPPTPPAQASSPAPKSPQKLDYAWWKNAIVFIKSQKPLVGSIFEHLGFESAAAANGETGSLTITLTYTKDHSFYKEQLQSPAYVELISQLLKNYLGRAVRLEYKEVFSNHSPQEDQKALAEKRRQSVLESEAMKATQQLLGARLEKLEVKGELNS